MKIKKITILSLVSALLINAVGQNSYYPVIAATSESNVQWTFDSDTEGWVKDINYNDAMLSAVTWDNGRLKVDVDYSNASDNGWAQTAIQVKPTSEINFEKYNDLALDVYYDPDEMQDRDITIKVDAANENIVEQMSNIKSQTVASTEHGLNKVTFHFELNEEAENKISDKLNIIIVGCGTDFSGSLWFDNIILSNNLVEAVPEKIWTFENDSENWEYNDSWKGTANIIGSAAYDSSHTLKVNLDFSNEQENGWAQTGISIDETINYSLFTHISFDLYYCSDDFTGNLTVKPVAGNKIFTTTANIGELKQEDASLIYGNGWKKVSFKIPCDKDYKEAEVPNQLMLLIVGNNTNYNNTLYFDNIRLYAENVEEPYVDSTIKVNTNTSLAITNSQLSINGSVEDFERTVTLADPNADASVVRLYQYLQAIGKSESIIFGHMEDTVLKAGSPLLTMSDTKDVTGSLSAIDGLDCGNLFDGFASTYNENYQNDADFSKIEDTPEGNVRAAAIITNKSLEEGAVMTLSSHMPNFAFTELVDSDASVSYAKYDFTKGDSYKLTGDTMNKILPGGEYNETFNAYLDMIADYANQVDGPILFRPFHENTGSWFWWGKAFCSPDTYKSVFKYTVEYLRDEKNVHNLLYVYGPGSEAASLEEYEERYPGDDYVDVVGFDCYDTETLNEDYGFIEKFTDVVALTSEFAEEHGKLFAVTETGISTGSKALLLEGNGRIDWYNDILKVVSNSEYECCYFMLWSNYSEEGSFYTPFVVEEKENGVLYGHELLDAFISFYNDARSIFAKDQLGVVNEIVAENESAIPDATVMEEQAITGYIVSPIALSNNTGAVTLSARLSKSDATDIMFRVTGNDDNVIVKNASVNGKEATATLTETEVSGLGEVSKGTIKLYSGDTLLQSISVMFNIPEKEVDLAVVDDFENYYGNNDILNGTWAVNKDSGCTLSFSLSSEKKNSGEYSLKFDYEETKTGWAGANIVKEVDWSSYNALTFWTIPDGNCQKTVVQINTSDGGSYEAYLNTYDEYCNYTEPIMVTLPFSDFTDKNGKGAFSSAAAANVSSFGLWVNAISDSSVFGENDTVSGSIYYDDIKAITSDITDAAFSLAVSCEHENTEVKNAKEATCTEAGYTGDTICGYCEEVLEKGEELEALGHDYKSEVTKEPTATEKGEKTYTCTRCEDSYTEEIPALSETCEHKNTTVKNVVVATCTSTGYTGDTVCVACGEIIANGSEIPMIAHDYHAVITKEPTITEKGERTWTCLACKESYTEEIPGLSEEISGFYVKGMQQETYSGKVVKPEPQIFDSSSEEPLQKGVDYTLSYKNNKNAYTLQEGDEGFDSTKAPQVIVKGKGNYQQNMVIYFTIQPKNIGDEDVIADEFVLEQNGKVQKKVPVVVYDKKKLKQNKDFVYSYPALEDDETKSTAFKENGTYQILVEGTGNYMGSRVVNLIITGKGTIITKATVKKIPNQAYNGGEPVELSATDLQVYVKVAGEKRVLVAEKDYTVEYENNTEIGTATVIVTGMGEYAGSKKATFKITGTSLAKATVEGLAEKTYNGEAQVQEGLRVVVDGRVLEEDNDYVLLYDKNTMVGTAKVTIQGINAYTGTLKKSFKITPYDFTGETDASGKTKQDSLLTEVNGLLEMKDGELYVKYVKGGCKPAVELSFNDKVLIAGKDYTVSYSNNKAVTPADKMPTITIKGKGNFKGKITKTFQIVVKDLADKELPVSIMAVDKAVSKKVGGYISKPVLTDADGKVLKEGKDYTTPVYTALDENGEVITLAKNSKVEAGKDINVTVKGIGAYTGELTATYRITFKSFDSAKVKSIQKDYTGKAVILTAEDFVEKDGTTSKIIMNGTKLVYGKDFEIVEGSYKNNIKKGTASVTLRGLGEYGGTKTIKFTIGARRLFWWWQF